MKHIIIIGFTIILFTSCDKQDKSYSEELTKIKTAKTLIKSYDHKSHERNIYKDSTVRTNNTKEDEIKKDKAAVTLIRYYYDMTKVLKNTGWSFKSANKN